MSYVYDCIGHFDRKIIRKVPTCPLLLKKSCEKCDVLIVLQSIGVVVSTYVRVSLCLCMQGWCQ